MEVCLCFRIVLRRVINCFWLFWIERFLGCKMFSVNIRKVFVNWVKLVVLVSWISKNIVFFVSILVKLVSYLLLNGG